MIAVMPASGNILVIRFKSIGDILFTLPAVHRLRDHFPNASLTFLVSRENAPMLEGFREVQTVLALDRAKLRFRTPGAALRELYSVLRSVRRGRFSLTVDLQGYGETAALGWWSGAPQRWGIVYGGGRRWAYTHGVNRVKSLHPAEGNLHLLEQCGIVRGKVRNEFILPDPALEAARQFFGINHLTSDLPTLFIQPFTSSPHKNWPLDRYLALAGHWRQQKRQVVFGGGPGERTALEPARLAGYAVAAGQPLLVAAGLTKLSSLVVGGDTGLLHLAVAMGRRVVMIMKSAQPGKPVPFQHPDWAVTPAGNGNVQDIETGAIIDACEQAFSDRSADL